MAPKPKKPSEEGYEVNIELKDQLNNIFYIDNVNDSDSIMLKDGIFTKTDEENIDIEDEPEEARARRIKDDDPKKISIFRDIYYLDNTVIQDLKTIFKKHIDKDKDKDKDKDGNPKDRGRDIDYNDPRVPVDLTKVAELMNDTNSLSKLHKIFTKPDYSKTIKDNIIHFNSGTNSRVKQLNSKDAIDRYIVDYYKYINNTKKTSDFDDDEKMDALMFYNVMYLLRNIYLKKQTILTNIQGEKYYVDEILFYDLPYIHMVRKDYDKPKKINIYLRIKTIPIIDIPIIKIHYIVDDLELQSLKLSAPREFKPVDLDKDFAKYSTMYIFDNFKYKEETDSMTAFFNSLKSEKRIDKIQELFFNADIVNKYKKRYYEIHKSKKAAPAKAEAKKATTTTAKERAAKVAAEKAAADKAAAEKKEADTIKYDNINANIFYLLRQNFNLIDNKISIDNTSIDDTYIAYDISNVEITTAGHAQSSVTVKYHSIMTNKKYNKYTNPKKEDIIKNIIAEHLKRFNGAKYKDDNFFYEDDRTDNRLPATVYNIIVIFRTFKQDSAKKKPSLMRRYIGDECLSNAVELDSIFSKLFYRTLGLPDKYLYDKFVNLTSKKTSATTNATTNATTSAPNIPGLPNIPIPSATKGGKKNNTKKFRTKKFRAKKHNTRKYRKNKFRTKKVKTKLLNAL